MGKNCLEIFSEMLYDTVHNTHTHTHTHTQKPASGKINLNKKYKNQTRLKHGAP